MQESNLVKVLWSFSKQEWKDFLRFVDSPFYNTNKQVALLVGILSESILSGNQNNYDKKSLFAEIYPGKIYNDTLMRKLLSLLYKLTEDFVVANKIRNSKITSKRIYLAELTDKDITKGYEKHLQQVERLLSEGRMDETKYLEKFLIEHVREQILSHENIMKGKGSKHLLNHLTNFYSYSYFKIEIYNYVTEMMSNETFEHSMTGELLKLEEKGFFKNEKPIQIFADILRLFILPEKEKLTRFKKIDSTDLEMHLSEIDCLYAFFCIHQFLIHEDIPDCEKLKWKYYKKFIELSIGNTYGIGQNRFGNIINSAINNNELDWAESFIKKNKDLLISEDKDAFWMSVYAGINIAKKNFEEALTILSKTSPKTPQIKDNVKTYTVICLYETEHFDELFNLIQTYRKFLVNAAKDYTKHMVQCSSNFIKAVNLILELRFTVEQEKKDKIEARFMHIINKKIIKVNWLKRKFNELKNLQNK